MRVLSLNRFPFPLHMLPAVVLVIGCAGVPRDDVRDLTDSSAARALLRGAAEAHGRAAFDGVSDISVSYDGQWLNRVGRLQPVLVDEQYRKSSQERLLLHDRLVAQEHRGPGGTKRVARTADDVRVWYDDRESTDADVLDAAAAVADGYELFLLAPFVLERDARLIAPMPRTTVDGHECDQVLVVLRDGLGRNARDRVVAAIDRQTKLVRRVRFTFNGLRSTRGVVADVTMSNWVDVGGIKWPTRFLERVQRPVSIDAHRWRLTGIDINRGLTTRDFTDRGWSARAAEPAKTLPPEVSAGERPPG